MTTPSPPPSNGNEGGSKPTTIDDSSSMRLTLQVDNTSALPIFLQGRTFAIRGGQLDRYTLDAKEPSQRQHIHTQLEQARRLRTILEDTASKVEALSSSASTSKKSLHAQAINILQSSLPHIHQLEKLTNSLEEGGGYTSSNLYGNDSEKTRKEQRREELMEKERLREQQIIRKHLREFVRESNPMAKIDDDEYEEMNDQETLIDEMNVKMRGTTPSASWPHTENLEFSSSSFRGRAAATLPTTTANKPPKRKSSHSPEDQAKKRAKHGLKRSKSSDSSRRDDARRKEGKKNKRSDKQPASRKVPQDVPSSSSASRPPSRMSNDSSKDNRTSPPTKKSPPPTAVVSKKMPKPRSMKKCHDCRKSSNRHRVCNYWKLTGFTGAKCGKAFCIDCLTSKYSVGDDVKPDGKTIEEIMKDSTLDIEWHCPSCLGACQCHVCVAQRKREEERGKNRVDSERKSQRRATAHSSYYNFF
ncbi:hypothetical protein ACHAWT_005385 [Skeletonema menzelii]|mmetsp:Transcript_5134/g.8455  ORF Transcript_5134/g.8455 Transcript_5134/m.8455 type:complete len:472 (+) Transcript_5134:32-1447(+)